MTKNKKGPELSVVLALVAVLISVCTMVISLVETSIMQKQQKAMTESSKASVWPYVTIRNNTKFNNGEIQFEATITNKGVGPAMIKKLEITYDGKELEKSVFDAIRQDCPDAIATSLTSNKINNVVLSPDETKEIISMSLIKTDFMNFVEFTEKLDIKYCYANIYGDLWASTDSTPVSTKICN